ncbi:MFS transporter [Kaistia dalseonensis]|uniref:MFS family arabinose efflux permease n=1 Tax=Kaistia dalseonensis TaxID=410840 RepID=A0ABU0HC23_9HYPH|nr:MFS transporter [Kaistia dalseonensis]MCX5497184.1 MFS transporter [Kaistia dalseonensis]MDQ0439815.1 putative MFS family arabinose efflux permease [Kaistia dalseonensis]
MTASAIAMRQLPGAPEQLSTRVAFFISGFGTASWAPLVPFAKARAGLDDGSLGLLLLCLGLGSIVAMPIAGALASRFGCRAVIIVSALLLVLPLPLLATLSSFALLIPTLLIFGAGVGSIDCVMNIQAVIVERASGRTMMSGFHGLFSVGGIVGAGGVSALLGFGASPLVATLCVAAIVALALAYAAPNLLPYGSESNGPAFAIPRGVVLFIGILCFIVFLTEGAVLDWSAVFLSTVSGLDPAYAGLGYTAFATTMTIGRLTGDAIVRRVGRTNIILFGGLCAAAGLLLATTVQLWFAGLMGYALVGAGCSNIVPVLYSAVGQQKTMPEHIAVPAITTLGYSGILAGPAAIGFVAHLTSLPTAFVLVAIALVGVALSGRLLKTGG